MSSVVRTERAYYIMIAFVLVCGLVCFSPTVAPAAESANGFCQSWLILGPYTQPGGAAPGGAIRLDYLTDGVSVRERTFIPTDGTVVNTDYSTAASTGFVTATQYNIHSVPTVFAWTDTDDLVNFNYEDLTAVWWDSVTEGELNIMAYCWTYANNKTGSRLNCFVGVDSDDSIQVKINGAEAGLVSAGRGQGGTDNVANAWPVCLEPGINLVMAKIFEGGGGYNFRLRFQLDDLLGTAGTMVPESAVDFATAGTYSYPANVATASRAIQSVGFYTVGSPTTFTITATTALGTPSPTVIEQPPAGWTIGTPVVSQGSAGVAAGKITWTVGALAGSATMRYLATPTVASGDGVCSGTITSDIIVYIAGMNSITAPTGSLGIFDWHGNIGIAGDPSTPGNATEAAGVYDITGSGSDVWDTVDRCHIAAKRVAGTFALDATVQWLDSTGEATWTKAGLMVRPSINSSDCMANVGIRNPSTAPGIGIFQGRDYAYGGCWEPWVNFSAVEPVRLLLIRRGTRVDVFQRVGTAWAAIGSHITPGLTSNEAVACLFATSHENGNDVTARFTNVSIISLAVKDATRTLPPGRFTTEPLTVAIGIQHASNSSPLIVTDAAPAGWTLSNPIPGGAVINGTTITWTLPSFTADTTVTYNATPPATPSILPQEFRGRVVDQLGFITLLGGDSFVYPAGVDYFRQGMFPDASYVGAADALIIMYANVNPGDRNSGANDYLEEGDWDGGTADNKLSLLSFSLQPTIPMNAIISEARLQLYYDLQRRGDFTATSDHTVYAHMLARPWGEGTGTGIDGPVALTGESCWNTPRQNMDPSWEVAGARGTTLDVKPPAQFQAVSAPYGVVADVWVELDVTSFVEYWAAHPGENYGLKISQDSAYPVPAPYVQGAYDFPSKEHANVSLRPLLAVKWVPRPPVLRARNWALYR